MKTGLALALLSVAAVAVVPVPAVTGAAPACPPEVAQARKLLSQQAQASATLAALAQLKK